MSRLFETEALQVPEEINRLAEIVKSEGVRSYLEIGSKFGGSLWTIARALPLGSRIVSVDMPNGTKRWKESSSSLRDCITELNRLGYDARVIWDNSTAPYAISQVKAAGPFDAVLLDADHRLAGVTADWRNYGPMGRIVAFHDIAWKRAPDWVGTRIDVPEFWDSIKGNYRHEEIKACPTGKNNGIGVLWRS
ncbi:class I SAM-dependent methyltransferase [Bradyrhizobium prioriisuperbiae]|uniref:class I SAM-dependent methyltransferase n=1 Tax=Bradyrhizobium prioriisuperbiae TaxID=2854389 RepID=UPI0028EB39C8|nr:class I SAM-dependent methyltransferase [Bradyrhizobium prioritasuperba]